MWIMGSDHFVSIVRLDNSEQLLIRARRPGDIERFFGTGRHVWIDRRADYRFRNTASVAETSDAVSSNLAGCRYRNFKDSVKSPRLHDAYLDVWHTMYALQAPERQAHLALPVPRHFPRHHPALDTLLATLDK